MICQEPECNVEINSRSKYCKTHKTKCRHNKRRTFCVLCDGKGLCIHGKRRTYCKDKECNGGGAYCEHDKIRSRCRECPDGGGNICIHDKQKSNCRDCGTSFCIHDKVKNLCRECNGTSFCEHGTRKNTCKACFGISICIHDRLKTQCKICIGGSVCNHGRIRSKCRDCENIFYCEHDTRKNECKHCDIIGYISQICRCRVLSALKSEKSKSTIEYLGCDIETFKIHIESQFKEGMSWENHGEWHIDHIKPVKYDNPTLEECIERLHYTNTQPLWADENISKGNRFIG